MTPYELFGCPGRFVPRYAVTPDDPDDFVGILHARALRHERCGARVEVEQEGLDTLRTLPAHQDGCVTEEGGEILVWIGGDPYPVERVG